MHDDVFGDFVEVLGRWELPALPATVRISRNLVRNSLENFPTELVDDISLATSELVTNAVIHAATDISLTIELWDSAIRLVVDDTHPDISKIVIQDEQTDSGRGLSIVNSLATAWGIEETMSGKKLWAAFATHNLEMF